MNETVECEYVIDTSSLLSLVRYYHPFDKRKILYKFIEERFIQADFILLASTIMEIKRVAQGIILAQYPFLGNKKKGSPPRIVVQKNLDIFDPELHKRIKSNWVNKKQEKRLRQFKREKEFETEYDKYIKGVDCQLILYALKKRKSSCKKEVIVVTEETSQQNDQKLFKKIPQICKIENIKCQTLPSMLQQLNVTLSYAKIL